MIRLLYDLWWEIEFSDDSGFTWDDSDCLYGKPCFVRLRQAQRFKQTYHRENPKHLRCRIVRVETTRKVVK